MLRSWLSLPSIQQPEYDCTEELSKVLSFLSDVPRLITFTELDFLKEQLSSAAIGNSFILQIGDCAEPFAECTDTILEQKLRSYEHYSNTLSSILQKPVILIGRVAGQFTKPRSEPFEMVNGGKIHIVQVCSYKGDLVNSFDLDKRKPDSQRLIQGYYHSAAATNFIRASGVKLFTSHEALHISYENALTRIVNDRFTNVGAHFLWLGERTRKLNMAHVEYLSQIANPVGVKIGPNADLAELKEIVRKLNPQNESGKIVLILRLGLSNYSTQLPLVIEAVKETEIKVLWVVDPMHGNTYKAGQGIKTRSFDALLKETVGSIQILKSYGEIPAGLHLEASYKDVTEVLGGGVSEVNLSERYETLCDPRLNYTQTVSFITQVAASLI